MKKVSLKVSKTFPAYHPRKGELTNFKEKVIAGEKIHTIRRVYYTVLAEIEQEKKECEGER